MIPPTSELPERLRRLEDRVDDAFAIDQRLRDLDGRIGKLEPRSRDGWDKVQVLGPYVSAIVVALIGFMLKDSVTLALQRETLNLEYVKQMRDLVQDFDKATTSEAANANAIGLAMFGKNAIGPLVERLQGGDLASLAAEKGLRMVGTSYALEACPRFARILTDKARLYTWQTHKIIIRLMGQSQCTDQLTTLREYAADLRAAAKPPVALSGFGRRYSTSDGFNQEGADSLLLELDNAVSILAPATKP